MNLICTRPGCTSPHLLPELLTIAVLAQWQGRCCQSCGMPLVLNDRYYPYQVLGKGGFGATYLAIDGGVAQQRHCVVKQLQPNPRFDDAQLELAQTLFRREATALAQFGTGHPQIPELYDFFPLVVSHTPPHQEFFYLVQEFIEGKTLSEEMKAKGPLPIPFVLDVFEQVLDILAYVHQHQSIHRDIKPSNLMYHPSGKVYLLDFGAVKQVSQVGGVTPDWSTSIYSPGYAPPEQVSGGAVYPATDLYALGVTCVVLLTGEKPRKLLDPYEQSWHYRDYVTISDALAAILDRCLASAPSDRFTSATEALRTLHHIERSQLLTGSSSWVPCPHSPPEVTEPIPETEVRHRHLPLEPLENPPGDDEETGILGEPSGTFSVRHTEIAQRSSVQRFEKPSETPPRFSSMELLAHGAFTGSEGGFLAILLSQIPIWELRTLLWAAGISSLILAQWQRWIEKNDLWVIPSLGLLLLLFFPSLRQIGSRSLNLGELLLILILTACAGIASLALFQLIYHLLQRWE